MLEPTDEDVYDAVERLIELLDLSGVNLNDIYYVHVTICKAIEELQARKRGER